MSVLAWAQTLWDYHHLDHSLQPADCIIVLGSHDTRVAVRGAQVFLAGWAPLLVFSGNLGSLTREKWDRPEAEIFADVAAARGVPRERILIENASTNTGENVELTRQLLTAKRLVPKRAIAVQKPYMERRTWATFQKRWPELEVVVTSPQVSFEEYPNEDIGRDDVIAIMVGDLQRILIYPERGFQVPQDVPTRVMEAYRALIENGYTARLIRD